MPVYKRKEACKQADGDKGTYTLCHKTKSGKEEKVGCATSKKNAQKYIAGSYANWDWKDIDKKKKKKSNEGLSLEEMIYHRLLEYFESELDLIDD